MTEGCENETQINFYRLDKTKPCKSVSAEASSKIHVFLIVFSVIFLAADAVFAAVYLTAYETVELTTIVGPVFLAVLGSVFLGLGIRFRAKQKSLKSAESELLKDCTLTDGRITDYSCVKSRDLDENSRTTYSVELKYCFFDKNFKLRSGKYSESYGAEPQFYKGQYLMIAFNETDSLILSEFTLETEDEKRFLQNEIRRSDDDFEGLTGELLDVNLKERVADYQYSAAWLWAAVAVLVFCVAFTVPISIFVLPRFFNFDSVMPDLIVTIMFCLMPLILVGVAAFLLKNYFVKSSHFKKIIKNRPFFTLGKMFASEKTYRGNARKKVFYCYIDKWGERHTDVVTSHIFHAKVQDETAEVIVAYTSAGDSTVITDCKFYEKEN